MAVTRAYALVSFRCTCGRLWVIRSTHRGRSHLSHPQKGLSSALHGFEFRTSECENF